MYSREGAAGILCQRRLHREGIAEKVLQGRYRRKVISVKVTHRTPFICTEEEENRNDNLEGHASILIFYWVSQRIEPYNLHSSVGKQQQNKRSTTTKHKKAKKNKY